MPFTVRIQNLGKLADATVRVAPLTILAGPNNTGKSFFSKALYSVFDAMNANPIEAAVRDELSALQWPLSRLQRAVKDWGRLVADNGQADAQPLPHLAAMTESIARAKAAAARPLNGRDDNDAAVNYDRPHPELERAVVELESAFDRLRPELEQWLLRPENNPRLRQLLGEQFVDELAAAAAALRAVGGLNRENLTVKGLSEKVSDGFSENFQIDDLAELVGPGDGDAVVDIVRAGAFAIGRDGGLSFTVARSGLLALRRFSRVVYLESPVLWKLKQGLDLLGRRGGWRPDPDAVPHAPGYYYDLVDALGTKYRGEEVAQAETRRLATEVVRGKIVLNELTGELLFAEAGAPKPRPLSVVSTGVANLAFLAMLAERKIVDRHSFLFIDEPEAHLHPGWDAEMTRLLFALARAGVHVVMATHSSDILECLSALLKERPEMRELTALNHFSPDGQGGARVVDSDLDFAGQMDAIQAELTAPFFAAYMEAL